LPLPELATVAEVAKSLRCSKRYVREQLIRGKLVTAFRVGDAGHWRIDAESVRALANVDETEAKAEPVDDRAGIEAYVRMHGKEPDPSLLDVLA